MSGGSIRRRSASSFELRFDLGTDDSGKRRRRHLSFKGSKAEAKIKLAELMAAAGKGAYVDSSKVTVAAHVRSRIDLWETAGDISPKTAERYRELRTIKSRRILATSASRSSPPPKSKGGTPL